MLRGGLNGYGVAIAQNALVDILGSKSPTERADVFQKAIRSLTELQHNDRAAIGFASEIVGVLEDGLNHPSSKNDNKLMQHEVGRIKAELPERPFIGTKGFCLEETALYAPKGYSRIYAKSPIDDFGVECEGESRLFIEATTACLPNASVTIFIRSGTTPTEARDILKRAAKLMKGYSTLEPFTPLDFTESDNSDDQPF